MASANTATKLAQPERFRVAVKVRLIELGMTITELANELGVSRNATSMAINHSQLFRALKERIRERLNLDA